MPSQPCIFYRTHEISLIIITNSNRHRNVYLGKWAAQKCLYLLCTSHYVFRTKLYISPYFATPQQLLFKQCLSRNWTALTKCKSVAVVVSKLFYLNIALGNKKCHSCIQIYRIKEETKVWECFKAQLHMFSFLSLCKGLMHFR